MGMKPQTNIGPGGQQQVAIFGIPQQHQIGGSSFPIYGIPASLQPRIQS